ARHPIDIDSGVDDLGQPIAPFALAAGAVHDGHEFVADALDEVAGRPSTRLGRCGMNQSADWQQ
ncbi:MAG: hypothetical protein WB902_12410, partial [Acetobacteraceae bacterium]